MWLRASPRDVRATREKRSGSFLHGFIKQSHTRNIYRVGNWRSISHMPLLSWASITCSLLHLPIVQVFCLDEFRIFQLTNTSCYRMMNYNQKPSEHFFQSFRTLYATQKSAKCLSRKARVRLFWLPNSTVLFSPSRSCLSLKSKPQSHLLCISFNSFLPIVWLGYFLLGLLLVFCLI